VNALGSDHGGKLPASDFVAPKVRRTFRVRVIGASPEQSGVHRELESWGAGESVHLDDHTPEQARHALVLKPVDAVLVVGPLWSPGSATAPPVLTPAGRAAEPYLRGRGWPVRWLRGEVCSPIERLPTSGEA
jgi:hypothetical protein